MMTETDSKAVLLYRIQRGELFVHESRGGWCWPSIDGNIKAYARNLAPIYRCEEELSVINCSSKG